MDSTRLAVNFNHDVAIEACASDCQDLTTLFESLIMTDRADRGHHFGLIACDSVKKTGLDCVGVHGVASTMEVCRNLGLGISLLTLNYSGNLRNSVVSKCEVGASESVSDAIRVVQTGAVDSEVHAQLVVALVGFCVFRVDVDGGQNAWV